MPRKNSFAIKLLSIVVPAYKQEETIVKNIRDIEQALIDNGYQYEIIIVVDGIVDDTYKRVKKSKSKRVKVIVYEKNQGKGHAIRYGMMHAKGDIIGFLDAGMDIHPAGFKMLINHME